MTSRHYLWLTAGLNAYFTFNVVGFHGSGNVPYKTALACIFIEGAPCFCNVKSWHGFMHLVVGSVTGPPAGLLRILQQTLSSALQAGSSSSWPSLVCGASSSSWHPGRSCSPPPRASACSWPSLDCRRQTASASSPTSLPPSSPWAPAPWLTVSIHSPDHNRACSAPPAPPCSAEAEGSVAARAVPRIQARTSRPNTCGGSRQRCSLSFFALNTGAPMYVLTQDAAAQVCNATAAAAAGATIPNLGNASSNTQCRE